MKRAIIVHCWGGKPDYAWYPWVQRQLEHEGYEATTPRLPDTNTPQLNKWLQTLSQTIQDPDPELILIGHSLGCATILTYLANLETDQQIRHAIFIAGFASNPNIPTIANFFESPIDLQNVRSKSKTGFTIIQSSDDPYVPMEYALQLQEELSGQLIVKENAGHMSGDIDNPNSCTQLPEIISTLKKLN